MDDIDHFKLNLDHGASLQYFGDNPSQNRVGTTLTTYYALHPESLVPGVKAALDVQLKHDKHFRKDVESIRSRKYELLFSESTTI